MSLLGETILEEMYAREWSLNYICGELGLDIDSFLEVLNGDVTDDVLYKLSKCFNVSLEFWENLSR